LAGESDHIFRAGGVCDCRTQCAIPQISGAQAIALFEQRIEAPNTAETARERDFGLAEPSLAQQPLGKQ
jgi:hypothetical protein